jgi:hypothetical protein
MVFWESKKENNLPLDLDLKINKLVFKNCIRLRFDQI